MTQTKRTGGAYSNPGGLIKIVRPRKINFCLKILYVFTNHNNNNHTIYNISKTKVN